MASKIIRSCSFISDAQILSVLEHWRFHKNTTKKNVFPPGTECISSDTVGLVATHDKQRIVLTKATLEYPNFFALLCKYLACREPTYARASRIQA